MMIVSNSKNIKFCTLILFLLFYVNNNLLAETELQLPDLPKIEDTVSESDNLKSQKNDPNVDISMPPKSISKKEVNNTYDEIGFFQKIKNFFSSNKKSDKSIPHNNQDIKTQLTTTEDIKDNSNNIESQNIANHITTDDIKIPNLEEVIDKPKEKKENKTFYSQDDIEVPELPSVTSAKNTSISNNIASNEKKDNLQQNTNDNNIKDINTTSINNNNTPNTANTQNVNAIKSSTIQADNISNQQVTLNDINNSNQDKINKDQSIEPTNNLDDNNISDNKLEGMIYTLQQLKTVEKIDSNNNNTISNTAVELKKELSQIKDKANNFMVVNRDNIVSSIDNIKENQVVNKAISLFNKYVNNKTSDDEVDVLENLNSIASAIKEDLSSNDNKLTQSQIKFIADETVMLLIEDDVVCGKLTESAKVEQMDFYAYVKYHDQMQDKLDSMKSAKEVDDFINTYYSNKKVSITRSDARDEAFEAIKKDNITDLKVLLDNSSILQLTNNPISNNTLLHTAVLYDNYPIVKYLIMRGINLESRNKFNYTALDVAYIKKEYPIAKLIQKASY